MHKPGTPFLDDQWKLYNLANDPTETHDLAQSNPGKLKALEELWESQAAQYGALPLKESPFGREGGFADAFLPNPYDY